MIFFRGLQNIYGNHKIRVFLLNYLQFRTWMHKTQEREYQGKYALIFFIDNEENASKRRYKKRGDEARRDKRKQREEKETKIIRRKTKKQQTPKTTATLVTHLYHPPTIIIRTLKPFRLPLLPVAEKLYLDTLLNWLLATSCYEYCPTFAFLLSQNPQM